MEESLYPVKEMFHLIQKMLQEAAKKMQIFSLGKKKIMNQNKEIRTNNVEKCQIE